jgi:multiple sugar transport system substrate-binding protein
VDRALIVPRYCGSRYKEKLVGIIQRPGGGLSRRHLLRCLVGAGLVTGTLPLLAACGGAAGAVATTTSPLSASTAGTVGTQSGATITSAPASTTSAAATSAGSTTAPVGATPSAPAAAKGGRTIVWSFWAVSQEQADNTLARVKDFNLTHPDITVQALFVQNGDYRGKIISLISAGTPPQLTQVDAYDMPYFVQQRIVQRLDATITNDKSFNLDDYLPGAFLEDHQVFNGAYYAMANGPESPRVLFYNKTKWQNAGLPLPNDLEAQGKWTWDAFLEAATKVATGVSPNRNYGFSAQLGFQPEPHTWIYSNGGKSLSDDRKSFIGTMPETAEALQFQADLILKNNVAPKPGENLGTGDSFLSGRMAMVEDGAWRAATLFTRPEFDYGVAPLPVSPKGVRKTVVKPNALTIPVGVTGQPAADAWELAKFIAGPVYQKAQIDVGQAITNLKSLVDYFVQKSPIRDAHVFMDAYNKGEVLPIPLIPQWQDYGKIYNAAFDKVRAGTSTVTDALSAIKTQTDSLLAIQTPKA